MRRRKKLLKKLLKLVIAITLIIVFLYLFKPYTKFKTADSSSNNENILEIVTVPESKIEIILPKTIHNKTNNSNTFEPLTEDNIEQIDFKPKYLETITNSNEVTIMVTNNFYELPIENPQLEPGISYEVKGLQEPMKSTYAFNMDNYDFPILLLLSSSGSLYYVDVEKACSTGTFTVEGKINNLPEVSNVYSVIATNENEKIQTAIIVCKNDEGYEFNLDMINK